MAHVFVFTDALIRFTGQVMIKIDFSLSCFRCRATALSSGDNDDVMVAILNVKGALVDRGLDKVISNAETAVSAPEQPSSHSLGWILIRPDASDHPHRPAFSSALLPASWAAAVTASIINSMGSRATEDLSRVARDDEFSNIQIGLAHKLP